MTLKKIGKNYHVSIRTAEGSVKTISTKCTNEDDAKKVVREAGIKEMELAARAGRLSSQAVGQIVAGKKISMAKALEQYQETLTRRRAAKTVANDMAVLNAWVRDMKLANMPPAAVTDKHIDQWINNPESPIKASTRRVNLSSIRNFFDHCAGHGWVVGNPANLVEVNMEILDHEQKEGTERQPFTKEDVKHLITHCRKEGLVFWEFAIRLSSETGLRLGDICDLEWRCFSGDKELTIWTGKSDKRLVHKISEAIAELSTQIPVMDAKYVFPEQRAIHIDPKKRSYLSVLFSRLCAKAGIKGKTFHSLRHHVATEKFAKVDKEALAKKLAATLSLQEIAALLGHSETKTTKGYVH